MDLNNVRNVMPMIDIIVQALIYSVTFVVILAAFNFIDSKTGGE
jgi:hypothetical protein